MNSPAYTFLAALVLTAGILASSGCSLFHNVPHQYATVVADPCHDEKLAMRETKRAQRLVKKGKLEEAEKALQKALCADVTYGPAHNDLGHVYLSQGKLYLAAWEFEYTQQLMPDRAEPYYNLGIVYEAAEQLDRAIECYTTAHTMDPKNPQYLGNLARAMLKKDGRNAEAVPLLSDLLLYDTRPEWVCWARERLAVGKFPKAKAESPQSPPPSGSRGVELIPPPTAPAEPARLPPVPEKTTDLHATPNPNDITGMFLR